MKKPPFGSFYGIMHQRWTCEGYFQNLDDQYHIWDLYVLGLKTKVFCRKKTQIHFPMDKGKGLIVGRAIKKT